jgi:hypothetical protein
LLLDPTAVLLVAGRYARRLIQIKSSSEKAR